MPLHEDTARESASWMPELSRVLLVHNFYRVRGGEDEQVEREVEILQEAGMEVRVFAARSGESCRADLVRMLMTLGLKNWKKAKELDCVLRDWKPSLIHIHNTFPLLTPEMIRVSVQSGALTLVTLHNYRVFCANAVCSRGGQQCTKCATSRLPYAAWHGCYRQSAVLSGWLQMLGVQLRRAICKYQPLIVAPSAFAASMLGQSFRGRVPMSVLPNVSGTETHQQDESRAGVVYIGRLSQEKGLADLMRAWRSCNSSTHSTLTIAGDGPLRGSLDAVAEEVGPSVRLVGRVQTEERDRLLRSSALCVVPSIAPETFGLVVAEAALAGCPVVVTDSGALPATMGGPDCGVVVMPGDVDALASAIDWVLEHPVEARERAERARHHAANHFIAGSFMSAFRSCISDANRAKSSGLER